MLWLQGWENTPELVTRCLRSWEYHNPGWTIRALDADTLPACVDLSDFSAAPAKDFTPQALSDIVRIELLATYGGVWVDAALFCRRPLDAWLFGYLDSGFFGFGWHQAPLCGFLAAAPGNPAVDIWRRETRAYWIGCPPRLRDSLRKRSPIGWVVEVSNDLARHVGDGMVPLHRAFAFWPLLVLGRWIRRHPLVYVSPLFRNVIKSAPYGWLFFLFKYRYAKHPEVRRVWNATPRWPPTEITEPRLFGRLCDPLSEDMRRAIDDAHLPLYFLDWRSDLAKAGPGTFLDHLFSTVPEGEASDPDAETIRRRSEALKEPFSDQP